MKKKFYVITTFNLWSERFVVGNMAGLKSVFCESIKKGWGVGWGMGGVFSFLGVWDWFQKLIW